MGRERPDDRVVDALRERIRPADVVMDVGAGTGRHTVPLARRCAQVVAVEPSDAMRAHLERRVADEGLDNVVVLDAEWPPVVEAPVADVVLSCHVVYGIAELPAFVRAMTERARRTCILVLGLRAPADALAPLARRIHGRPRPVRPAASEALSVLHELGLAAHLTVLEGTERAMAFGLGDDDVAEVCLRLGVRPDDSGRERVREALGELPQNERGEHVVGTTGPNALIAWDGEAGAHDDGRVTTPPR